MEEKKEDPIDEIEEDTDVDDEPPEDTDDDGDEEPEQEEDEEEDDEGLDEDEDGELKIKGVVDIGNDLISSTVYESEGDDDEEYEYDEEYLGKFDDELKANYIADYHPEEVSINYDEVRGLTNITRDRDGIIVDELHKSIPVLTKYEYTNILGIRAKQLNEGAQPFVKMEKERKQERK
jgi:DNA polymerase phi